MTEAAISRITAQRDIGLGAALWRRGESRSDSGQSRPPPCTRPVNLKFPVDTMAKVERGNDYDLTLPMRRKDYNLTI